MLRNPAYPGRAAFAKTMRTEQRVRPTRPGRLAGRSSSRNPLTCDRPAEDWVQIAVPAIVSEESFQLAGRRLKDNQRFVARNTKVPSLLQGLAACQACALRRLPDLDPHRYAPAVRLPLPLPGRAALRQPAGARRPPRPGHLGPRHRAARRPHPDPRRTRPAAGRVAGGQPHHGRQGVAPARADPHRDRHQPAGRGLPGAAAVAGRVARAHADAARQGADPARPARRPGAELVDQETYLKLAETLEGFLARLRGKADTASVPERQRVLRLLVKEVLIGPERVVIRHRIPITNPEPTPGY
jgi:site-specific DNA recombinase